MAAVSMCIRVVQGITEGTMCRRRVQKDITWKICAGSMKLGSMYRRGVWKVMTKGSICSRGLQRYDRRQYVQKRIVEGITAEKKSVDTMTPTRAVNVLTFKLEFLKFP